MLLILFIVTKLFNECAMKEKWSVVITYCWTFLYYDFGNNWFVFTIVNTKLVFLSLKLISNFSFFQTQCDQDLYTLFCFSLLVYSSVPSVSNAKFWSSSIPGLSRFLNCSLIVLHYRCLQLRCMYLVTVILSRSVIVNCWFCTKK